MEKCEITQCASMETVVESDTDKLVVKVKNLPAFGELRKEIDGILKQCSWFDKYGVDWLLIIFGMSLIPAGISLMSSQLWSTFLLGMATYGLGHTLITAKAGHIASHGGLCETRSWIMFWTWFFIEVAGQFSWVAGYEIHIKCHHPYTNIIGLGDSSMWKAPFLPSYVYMFVAPLLLPWITPIVSLTYVWGRWSVMSRYILWASFGFLSVCLPLMWVSELKWYQAVGVIFMSRSILSVPYIHVNIFQHIGLSMYSAEKRPSRLYQMSTGVLNLSRNPLLDRCFGHSLVSCHVEHHLFPNLSDHMCLRIKPVVRDFLHRHGLPYQEDTYLNRLFLFVKKYDEFMVHAPPITHFVGLQ